MKLRLLIGFIFITGLLFGQRIQTGINQDTIKIGESIIYQIVVPIGKNTIVEFPSEKDTLAKNIEIIDRSIDTIQSDKGNFLRNTINLTSFEPGNYLLRTLPVKVNNDTVRTKSFKINVLEVAIDSTQNKIYPIKPILNEQLTVKDYLKKYWIYIAVASVLLLILTIVLVLFLTRKKKKKSKEKPKTPYEEALILLEKLDKKDFLEKNQIKAYYSELGFILKNYLGKRFQFRALKFLSNELVDHIQKKGELDTESCRQMHQFLDDADGVKFAKAIPPANKHKEYRQLVQTLIEKTKPVFIEENEVFNQRKNT